MPFKAPFADDVAACPPFADAGEPWACARVVCAGEFCDENLELMLDIHEFLRDNGFASDCARLPGFSELPRLSSGGRFTGPFCAGGVATGGGEGGEISWTAGAGDGCSSWGVVGGVKGVPSQAEWFVGASLEAAGEVGACGRWW